MEFKGGISVHSCLDPCPPPALVLPGTFRCVPPGQYAVLWRMKLDDVTIGAPTTFSATVRAVAPASATTSLPVTGCSSLDYSQSQVSPVSSSSTSSTADTSLPSIEHASSPMQGPATAGANPASAPASTAMAKHPSANITSWAAESKEGIGGAGFVTKWHRHHWTAMEQAYGSGAWFEAAVGVVVLREHCHVDVEMCSLDVDWKGSVFLDYVVLQSCD